MGRVSHFFIQPLLQQATREGDLLKDKYHRQTIKQYNTLYRVLFNTNGICRLIITFINNIFDMIFYNFICVDNPKYHLCCFRGTFTNL